MFRLFTICLIILGMFIGNCASIVNGPSQRVSIRSNQDSLDVKIYDASNMMVTQVQAPAAIDLKRGDGFFRGAKYRLEAGDQNSYIDSNISMWYLLGNIMFGGVLGYLVIDPLTGGMYTLSPEEVYLNSSVSKKPTKEKTVQPSNDGNFNDIVALKNGDILSGVKTAVTGDSVVVVYPNGDTKVFPKSEVVSVKKK
jgi:hypothetical protein